MARISGAGLVGTEAPLIVGGDASGTTAALTVTGLRGRALSAVVPNVGDFLEWSGTEWVPTPAPLFGAEFVTAARFAPVSTTNAPASAVLFVSLGSVGTPIPLDPAGAYMVATTFVVDVTASNTEFWVELYFGGIPTGLGPSIEQLSVAGGSARRTTLISTPAALVPSPFWIDLAFAKSGGRGAVTLRAASLNVWRVG
jgi:hypothetical protein